MSKRKLTVELPEAVFAQLARLAELLRESPEALAARSIASNFVAALDELPSAPPDEVAHLEGLANEALLQLAASQIDAETQERHLELLEKNQAGTIVASEQEELATLRQVADQLMLRKAIAWDILGRRGQTLPPIEALLSE